jgi:hypothetical protein
MRLRLKPEQVFTLLLLAGFVALTTWLLGRTQQEREERFPPLTTYSPRPDGAQALYELLQRTARSPRRYNGTEYHYPPDSCMVVLLPDDAALDSMVGADLDAKALRLWLEDGGRLVLAGSLDAGTSILLSNLFEELQVPTSGRLAAPAQRIALRSGAGEAGRADAPLRSQGPGTVFTLAAGRPALWKAVEQIETAGSYPAQQPQAVVLLATAEQAGSTPQPLVLYRKVGRGELFVLTRPEILSNAWLPRQDNAAFALALLDGATRGRPLLFDEHIHGYLRTAPNVLALLVRTGGGRMLLAAAALSLLLFAGAAVRPARWRVDPTPARRQGTELVLAQADLYQRAGARQAVADSQLDSLRRAYMQANSQAHPPSDRQLLTWVSEGWTAAPAHKVLLAEYIRTRTLPRTATALLELTQACDRARAALQLNPAG